MSNKSELIRFSSSFVGKVLFCWLVACPVHAELESGFCCGSPVAESTGQILSIEQKAEARKAKSDKSMSPWMKGLVMEGVAVGYGYWAAEGPKSYVAVTSLTSVIFGAVYIADKKPESLGVSLAFGVMALRRRNIDTENTPKREIARSTFIDLNVLLGLSLLMDYFLPDQDGDKSNQKTSLEFIPRTDGGVMMLSHRF